MAIHDRNEIIFMGYDSIVSFERTDYSVVSRYNYSNPVLSYLMYEIVSGDATRYLWYDKKDHRIAVLDPAQEQDLSAMKALVTDDFHVQIEKKSGAPSIFQTRLGVYASPDNQTLVVRDARASETLVFSGQTVATANITIYPYDEK